MNMLRRLQVTNFKSLMETEIRLEKNTFLIGLNGSGKTSILQSIDFLSAIAKGKVDEWLKIRGWEKSELTFSGNNKKLIEFQISFKLRDNEYRWDFTFNRDLLRNTSEKYTKCSQDEIQVLLEVKEGHYALLGSSKNKIAFNYEGSIISVLKDEALGEELKEIRNFFSNIKSAELLTPLLMKKRARQSHGEIGLGGEKLSAFIYELPYEKKQKLLEELKRFFPNIVTVQSNSLQAGWKELTLNENFGGRRLKINSKHLSDGFLRIIAILAQLLSSESVLLFDEIEDGVNQELFYLLVEFLMESPHQTIVATHSPLLLNYLDDEMAKRSMLFVYRDAEGITKTENFFDLIERFQKMDKDAIDLFGPGEWMQSIDLLEISRELAGVKGA